MALTVVAARSAGFSVLGDNVTTILVVDLATFGIPETIKRVQDLTVTGIVGLTATRTFTGSTVTITFSAPWVGVANVSITVLI